jgi:nucleotide-binding universal stress UspA family protein
VTRISDRVPASDRSPASDRVPASDGATGKQPAFGRVLVPVQDASQIGPVVELAQRAGVSQARVLHLNLRESIGGRRFALETESSASYVVEAALFTLSMAGIRASGQVRHALVDRAAEAIVAEAIEWGADLIVLGCPHRGELAARLFGSVTLRVLQHAPCPVLVASRAGRDRLHHVQQSVLPVTGPDPDVDDGHPIQGRSDQLSATRVD